MELTLIREQYRPDSTIGRLLVDGTFECFTLEDGVRTTKVFGETAIPPGTYRITVEDSPRFKRKLPRLHEVPNFSGVLIHTGNKAAETHGCILVGRDWRPGAETIGASRPAFEVLFGKILAALGRGEAVAIVVEQPDAPRDLVMRAARPRSARRGAAAPRPKKAVPKRPARKAAAARGGGARRKPVAKSRARSAARPKRPARPPR